MPASSLQLLLYVRGRNIDGEMVSNYISFSDTDKMNAVLTQAYQAIESGERQGRDSHLFYNWIVTHAQLVIEKSGFVLGEPVFAKDVF
jgi:hypothetical protein